MKRKKDRYKSLSETIGRDASPKRKLNPPVFEENLVSLYQPGSVLRYLVQPFK
jgi:hypothetical protein